METSIMKQEKEIDMKALSVQAIERQKETEGAIIIAKKFPRNSLDMYGKLIESTKRFGFADAATYSYKRGTTIISGPSINLAKEAARLWGNIRYGIDIVNDDDESVTIQAWAWDMENNTRDSQENKFKKLIYRKVDGWKKPDERDLRELVNRHGSLTLRNCLLNLMPKDFIDDAVAQCKETLKNRVGESPKETLKKVVKGFTDMGITVKMLETRLTHPLNECSVDEITDLREIYKSIRDGAKRKDYFQTSSVTNGILNVEDLKAGDSSKHQGHNSNNTLKPNQKPSEVNKMSAEQIATIYDVIGTNKKANEQLFKKYKVKKVEDLAFADYEGILTFLAAWTK